MICCVCLEDAYNTLNIFDENGKFSDIAHVLGKHLWFEPSPGDPVSTAVCCDCWQCVYNFHQFYKKIEQAHIILGKFNTSNVFDFSVDGNFSVGPQSTEAMDIKEELMEKVCSENITEIPGFVELNPLDLKEGSILKEENDHFDNELLTELNGKRISRTKPSSSSTLLSEIQSKCKRSTKKAGDIKKKANKGFKHSAVKSQRCISEFELDMISKHISMQCEQCYYITKNYNDFVEHFRMKHQGLRPSVKCCGRKLNKRFLFVQHALKHENPEYFNEIATGSSVIIKSIHIHSVFGRCKECNKILSDSDGLRTHMLENHAPKEELKYVCEHCPKRFSKQHFLNLHKVSHIPPDEWKFLCENCPQPKYFASEHLLKTHRNAIHIKAVNVCHVCAKEIRCKTSFDKHVRSHFESSGPRLKCSYPGCDSLLKDEDNLKIHMRRHNIEGEEFICKHCNKICKNRNTLTSHIHYVHNDKTYNCDICNKSFKKALTLKEHMAQHTGGVLYQCPFCTRTFNSNANMHSHKKKMHPIEWLDWRKTKKK